MSTVRVLLCCALAGAVLQAQTGLGRIGGTVVDSSGLRMPGVVVSVQNTDTGEQRQTTSNEEGVYVLSPLQLGNYTLTARKDGFKAVSRSGIRVDANAAISMDVTLEPGAVAESVTVEARTVAIETDTAAVGNSRYEVQLKNLPVTVREIQTVIAQTAGVPAGSTDTIGGTFNQGGRSAMQVVSDGAQVNAFQTTAWPAIDGIDRRADLAMPSLDAIAEVKFTSSGGAAEYSQPTQVIAVSKSGTNDLHGSAFEFYRSGGMGARRWEDAQRTTYVRHQFGGSAGGPIKKDKAFFFGSADIFRHTAGQVFNARYPTAAERSGNLTSYLSRVDAQGRPAPVSPIDPRKV